MIGTDSEQAPWSTSWSTYSALAIHTGSNDLGIALRDQTGEVRRYNWDVGRQLSSQLHEYLVTVLPAEGWPLLSWLAVTIGPGGFTSTRIGVVTARTLAQQLTIPLFGISSLAAIAWCHRHQVPIDSDLVIQLPAQRGEVYGAIYRRSQDGDSPQFTAKLADGVFALDRWNDLLSTWGRPYQLIVAAAGLGDTAIGVLELATLAWQDGQRPHWAAALPFYGQHPVHPNR